jgi:hypothetical protein
MTSIRRLVRQVDVTCDEYDEQAITSAVLVFAGGVGAANAEIHWATSMNDALDQAARIAVEVPNAMRQRSWPVVRHEWPWGGVHEFRLFQSDQLVEHGSTGLSDSPELQLFATVTPDSAVTPGEFWLWSLNFDFAVRHVAWALRDERRLSRAAPAPSDRDVANLASGRCGPPPRAIRVSP